MKFWLLKSYYKRSNWKIWLAERFSEALTSKLWNKKNTCCRSLQKWSEIELYSSPYGFIKNLPQIHLRDNHVKFTGKNKVGNTTWEKLRSLIGQKQQNSFQWTHRENFFVSIRRAGEQASQHLAPSFPFSDFYILSSLLGCYFSGTSCPFHFGQMFNGFLTGTFNFYWSLALQLSCTTIRLSEAGIFFQ